MTQSPLFQLYVDAARDGRSTMWRTLLGALLIVLVWVAGISIVILLLTALPSAGPDSLLDGSAESPIDVAATLASFMPIWLGVWLALRLLHRRPLSTVIGADGRLSWPDFARGVAAAVTASAVLEVVTFIVDPNLQRGAIGVGQWLALFLPLAVLLLVQTSAEEVAFRGYLLQALAARFRSPLIWGVIPGGLFTLAHWGSATLPWMNVSILVGIAAFTATATILVYATGNLGAAMGVHFGTNIFAILVVSHMNWLSSVALFVGSPLDAAHWTMGEALALSAVGLAAMPITLWLLLSSRSPLRLRR